MVGTLEMGQFGTPPAVRNLMALSPQTDSSLLLQLHVSWLVTPSFAVSHSRPLLSLLSATQQVDRPLPDFSSILLNFSPLKSRFTVLLPPYTLSQLSLLHPLAQLVNSAACTVQPGLNCPVLDMTLVCPLSAQWSSSAVLWFVRKRARISLLPQNSLKEFCPMNPTAMENRQWNGRNKF